MNYEEALELVKKSGCYLEIIPKKFRTPELCKIAVKKDGWVLEYVPYQHKTPELCEIAVKDVGLSLQYVPDQYKTPKLCEIAVTQNGSCLKYVPNKKEFFKHHPLIQIRHTFKKDQTSPMLSRFFKTATISEIEEIADFICWNKVTPRHLPLSKLPLFINTQSKMFKKYITKRLSKRS